MGHQANTGIDSSDESFGRAKLTVVRRIARKATVACVRLLSVLTGFAYVKYYTNILTVEQVGVFFYLSTLSFMLNALIFVPVDGYMQARIANLNELPYPSLKRLIGTTLLGSLAIYLCLSAPFLLMHRLRISDVPLLYALAALLYLCSSVRSLVNIRGHSMFVSWMIVFESAARLIAFVAVATVSVASARGLIFSWAAVLAAELVILLWRARNVLPLSSDSMPLDAPAKVIRTSSALAGGAVSNIVQLQAYRVLFPLAGHAGTAATLAVVANIGAAAMSICSQLFAQLFVPRLYQSRGNSIKQYAVWGAMMSGGVLAAGLLLCKALVLRLTQVIYLPYAPAVGVGIVVEASNMLIAGYGIYLTLHGKTGILAGFQLGGAMVSFAGCLILLAWLPASPLFVGSVVAGSQLIVTLALAFYVHRVLRRLP